jgi:glycosyltransferase involved in cell wall biosynthesis
MLRLLVPKGLEWELLIIDNGTTDAAARVVANYASLLPIRRIEEPVPGLSHARNRGVKEARGRYICWTDDDVSVDPRWLAAYAEAFARHPEAVLFGGRIFPELDPPTPRWFTQCRHCWPITSVIAERDMGDGIIPLEQRPDRVPWGANFAVRAEEQKRFSYDPALGLSPLQHRIGEESDVIYRIMSAGGRGWWVPQSIVRHRIARSRQTLGHILNYFRKVGETAAYKHDIAPGDNWNEISGLPSFLREEHLKAWARTMLLLQLFAIDWLRQRTCSALRHWARLGVYLGVASYRGRKRASDNLVSTC